MTKKLVHSIVFLAVWLSPLILDPVPCARALDTSHELAQIRKARDLIDARRYEDAHKILETCKSYDIREVEFKARHRMAELEMRKDRANPYYDLYRGSLDLRSAMEYGKEPYAQWAYAEMLKESPYLRMMPQVLAREVYKWNLPAAEKGFALSQQELGMVLSEGAGPRTDYEEAYMWLKLACDRYARAPDKERPRADSRMAVAAAHMAVLERMHLGPRQIQKALKMAKKWEKKHPDAYQAWPVEDQDY